MHEEIRDALEAYAGGVNLRIQDVEGDPENLMPLELEGKVPLIHWSAHDCLAITATTIDKFGQFGGNALSNLAAYNSMSQRAFDRSFPLNTPGLLTTIRSGPEADSPIQTAAAWNTAPPLSIPSESLAKAEADRAARYKEIEQVFAEHGMPVTLGSFAVAVHPSKAQGGRPLLLSCPEMGIDSPQISCQISLHGGGLNAGGMTFAGMAVLPIGRNQHVAWAATSGVSDNTDIFIEELNPENHEQYLHKGKWKDMERNVLSTGSTEYLTVHGRIFSRNLQLDPPVAYAERSTFRGQEWQTLDQDGMSNTWEVEHLLNLLFNDSKEDLDGDRYYNWLEYQDGTAPRDERSHPDRPLFNSPSISNGILRISWIGSEDYILEMTEEMGNPVWTPVAGQPVDRVIELPLTDSKAFYRLIRP